MLRGIDWIEPEILERRENRGLSRSIRDGLDRVFEDHGSAIVIEDDVCVAPGFYDYARLALGRYEDEPAVAGITGLRYPFSRDVLVDYPYDVFMSPRFSSWGWATWRDRWPAFEFDPAALRARIAGARAFDPAIAGADMAPMIEAAIVNETLGGSWDVACATNMLLDGRYFVTPTWNMVENSGLEHGTHADGAPQWELTWEEGPAGWPGAPLRFAPPVLDEGVLGEYRRFFAGDLTGGPLARSGAAIARWRAARRLRGSR